MEGAGEDLRSPHAPGSEGQVPRLVGTCVEGFHWTQAQELSPWNSHERVTGKEPELLPEHETWCPDRTTQKLPGISKASCH